MPPTCPHSVAPGGHVQEHPSGPFHCVSQDPEGKTYTLCAANTSKDESRFEYQLEVGTMDAALVLLWGLVCCHSVRALSRGDWGQP